MEKSGLENIFVFFMFFLSLFIIVFFTRDLYLSFFRFEKKNADAAVNIQNENGREVEIEFK